MLETELRGAAKTVVDALLYTPEMYNVTSLKEAFESKDYDTVVSIIISSRNDSLMDMKEKYFAGEYNCFFTFVKRLIIFLTNPLSYLPLLVCIITITFIIFVIIVIVNIVFSRETNYL